MYSGQSVQVQAATCCFQRPGSHSSKMQSRHLASMASLRDKRAGAVVFIGFGVLSSWGGELEGVDIGPERGGDPPPKTEVRMSSW